MKPMSILPTHAHSPIYPKLNVTDILRRNGFKDNCYGIVPTQLIPALLTDSRVETLLKAGHTDYLRYFLGNKRTFEELWQSKKIANRDRYEIIDISLWYDMWTLSADWTKALTTRNIFVLPTLKQNKTITKSHANLKFAWLIFSTFKSADFTTFEFHCLGKNFFLTFFYQSFLLIFPLYLLYH